MKYNKRFPAISAWYYRNFVYKKEQLYTITFDIYVPKLFETLYTSNGVYATYLGKGKFVETKRLKNLSNFSNVPKIEI